LAKNGLGYTFGHFFIISSGSPGSPELKKLIYGHPTNTNYFIFYRSIWSPKNDFKFFPIFQIISNYFIFYGSVLMRFFSSLNASFIPASEVFRDKKKDILCVCYGRLFQQAYLNALNKAID
jgi:hypothetical protein